jgi:hypothetical protein
VVSVGPGGPNQGKGGQGKQRTTADPDSPFAKLGALKAELEKRTQGGS